MVEKTKFKTGDDAPAEDLQGRCCKNCAVSLAIQGGSARICRLTPPVMVFKDGQPAGISQGQVFDAHVCWSWREPGTLPGESNLAAHAPVLSS